MDNFEQKILRELRSNGRMSNVELAERVGLSPSATLRRVQELERSGVITGYSANISRDKLGVGFIAYVSVGLSSHRKRDQLEFEQHVAFEDEVVECHNITGASEYLLRVETQDLSSYKRFHSDVLGECQQVNSITTMVVMDTPKDLR